MKRSRFTEEQITYALRQNDAGTPTTEICRQLGVSEATFYVWKKKYAHLGVAELRELRHLREENTRLKRLVADLTLDKQILTNVVKKDLKPGRRRALLQWILPRYRIPVPGRGAKVHLSPRAPQHGFCPRSVVRWPAVSDADGGRSMES